MGCGSAITPPYVKFVVTSLRHWALTLAIVLEQSELDGLKDDDTLSLGMFDQSLFAVSQSISLRPVYAYTSDMNQLERRATQRDPWRT